MKPKTKKECLDALLTFMPIVGEIRDLREIGHAGRDGFYANPTGLPQPDILTPVGTFLTCTAIRYVFLGYGALAGYGIYKAVEWFGS